MIQESQGDFTQDATNVIRIFILVLSALIVSNLHVNIENKFFWIAKAVELSLAMNPMTSLQKKLEA